jgi:hypothetical protein
VTRGEIFARRVLGRLALVAPDAWQKTGSRELDALGRLIAQEADFLFEPMRDSKRPVSVHRTVRKGHFTDMHPMPSLEEKITMRILGTFSDYFPRELKTLDERSALELERDILSVVRQATYAGRG